VEDQAKGMFEPQRFLEQRNGFARAVSVHQVAAVFLVKVWFAALVALGAHLGEERDEFWIEVRFAGIRAADEAVAVGVGAVEKLAEGVLFFRIGFQGVEGFLRIAEDRVPSSRAVGRNC